ncbi:MAG TPA: DNA-3-methyladenine glycosylase [Candidatus Saccharimonadia bacterium]|jgi:DNA-3-methyladenine glycosylase
MNRPAPRDPQTYEWLTADCLEVAPKLLGWELVSRVDGLETGGRIVECEAYHGLEDPASHAFRGPTKRTAPMFEAGGQVYVYLSYGIHTCMNIVTGRAGEGQAILLRALEPTIGLDVMIRRRGTSEPRNLCSGPGKLTQALGIGLTLSGARLGETLFLRPPAVPHDPALVITGPRIGITKALHHPWRFYLHGNPHISRR